MPTYGYRCTRGHQWEVVQPITDAPLTVCPECGSPATRIFYPVGIVFKGQGFYKTDSRGSGGIASGTTGDGAGKDGKSDKDGKSSKEPSKTETKAKAASDSASKDGGEGGGAKADAPSTSPPAKSEEKTA